ncbi:translation factor GTPase family protein [Streptomyces sp. NPDC094034]|uniref:translation factor GTPase family protein n=1 Tax=Streptomyces sp. NPDC094034 TaxID=3155309 RepID=UPI00332C2407
MSSILNLGILAHIDAGKTSLTERLLYTVGAIDEVGSVDAGNTRTDSLDLERKRGITIKSAVVAFTIEDLSVNLIDTPGHPDFIAEVERVLSVLDGVVLVLSAVEGVQAQTRVLMRTLQRLRIPTLIFVNKIDRRGGRYESLLQDISEKLTPAIFPMGSVNALGTRQASFTPYDTDAPDTTDRLFAMLADHDETLLAAYVDNKAAVPYARLWSELAAQTRRAQVHPVFFGSAITGVGVTELIVGIRTLLPMAEAAVDSAPSGTVFKVERDPGGEKVAYVRMFSGAVRSYEKLPYGQGKESKVTEISVFDNGSVVQRSEITAGNIGRIKGLGEVQIWDAVGEPRATNAHQLLFSPPTLETVVVPRRSADRGALYAALSRLAEQDPLINLRQDTVRRELSVSLYGEVQKEVIQDTLAEEFGVDVTFHESTTICVERVVGTGEALEVIGKEPNPFLATIGLRVEPAPIGTGLRFRLAVPIGSLPTAFMKALEETVRESLSQGLRGWQVTDCTVTLTEAGYWAVQSHAADFRRLAPLVALKALEQAGTRVCEPVHRFRLEIPAELLGALMPVLQRSRAVPEVPVMQGPSYLLTGVIPAARVHKLEQQLPALTSGEGVMHSVFDHYQPVTGKPPTRPRSDHNPLNRKEYLLNVARRA